MWGNSIKGPELADLKATVENLRVTLSGDEYINGMDQATTIQMVGDIYSYVVGKLSHGLQLPAPADDPDDRGRVMWPDGMKVKSRRGSISSVGSGRYVKADRYGTPVAGAGVRGGSRASSATSTSKYSSRYVGIAEEEEDDEPMPARRAPPRRDSTRRYAPDEPDNYIRPKKHVSYAPDDVQDLPTRPSTTRRPTGTHRVSDAAMKPTPSMERFIDQPEDDGRNPWEQPEEERRPARKPKTHSQPRQGGFADDD